MTIPQIKGPWRIILLILIMTPIGALATSEKHSFSDMKDTLQHAIPLAISLAAGWIFFASPWAAEYRSIYEKVAKTDTTTKLSGDIVEQHTETKVTATVETTKPDLKQPEQRNDAGR
jgi:hypothetical protein